MIQIRSHVSSKRRECNTTIINSFTEELLIDYDDDRIVTFLRRAGHRVDGYIIQEIGPYPGRLICLDT